MMVVELNASRETRMPSRYLGERGNHKAPPRLYRGICAFDVMSVPGEVPEGRSKKTNSLATNRCSITAALRPGSNGDNDFAGFLVVRNEHHRRDASLFSIAVQFPKLDVAGSIPVSRSSF